MKAISWFAIAILLGCVGAIDVDHLNKISKSLAELQAKDEGWHDDKDLLMWGPDMLSDESESGEPTSVALPDVPLDSDIADLESKIEDAKFADLTGSVGQQNVEQVLKSEKKLMHDQDITINVYNSAVATTRMETVNELDNGLNMLIQGREELAAMNPHNPVLNDIDLKIKVMRKKIRAKRLELNPCEENPCLNNGECQDLRADGKFKCFCRDPWYGKRCQKEKKETPPPVPVPTPCEPNPCDNGGDCKAATGGNFTCACLEGYTGDLCTEVVKANPCEFDNGGCQNGATCAQDEENGGVSCECVEGFSGEQCEIDENAPAEAVVEESDACVDEPCQNGVCKPTDAGSYTCECSDGYTGENCDEKMLDPCAENPCENGGTCSGAVGTSDYECACPEGYTGDRCESEEVEPSSVIIPPGHEPGTDAPRPPKDDSDDGDDDDDDEEDEE